MPPTPDDATTRQRNVERYFRTAAMVIVGAVGLVLLWLARDYVRPELPETLVVYGYSTVDDALREGIFPAFQQQWRERTGKSVEFVATFAGSGTITGKILQRVPAEVAVLSSRLDAQRLLEAGFLRRSALQELPFSGVLSRTPVVILVRAGNPKGIRDFADLRRDGVRVVHADPTTSGGAQWSILAAYGSAFLATGDRQQAHDQLLGIWRNVALRLPDARAARREFDRGTGDALITYEQDVLGAPGRAPAAGEIVYPRRTILSEQVALPLDRNVDESRRALVGAFVDFLWSAEAQRILVDYGFRTPLPELDRSNPSLGELEAPFTLDELGGPRAADREIVQGVWRGRVLPELATAPQ